jgi:RimJ/RimL family protein N-acetyltransferase
MPLTTLTSERLTLRPPRPEDAEAIFRGYATDPQVARFVLWTPHQSIAETEEFLAHFLEHGTEADNYPWVITRSSDAVLIGAIHLRVEPPRAELGFNLARDQWGRGYGTEVVRAAIGFGLGLGGVSRVQAVCHVDNKASARVLEKAGMKREARLHRYLLFPNFGAEPQDVYLYASTE